MARMLPDVRSVKACETGDRVTFRAKALRIWEMGGVRMALAGDASGLTRVEIGDAPVETGRSYEFRDASVRQYPGGWTSVSVVGGGDLRELDEEINVPQDEAYIERTFKILSGIQRKRARQEGRAPPWEHPAAGTEL